MALSPADQALLADMRQREQHLKSRQRAADAVRYAVRRYRTVVTALTAAAGAALGVGLYFAVDGSLVHRPEWWRPLVVNVLLGIVIGVQLGRSLLRSQWGRRRLAHYEAGLRRRYASELYAARRWQSFYYEDEDISAYVPQILYFIDAEQRFDSVRAALAFAKDNRHDGSTFAWRAREAFTTVAGETNVVVVSTVDRSGMPASRIMPFVRSERPAVWYVTTAPEGNKVHAFEHGRIAVLTVPTEAGATISSNQVRIRRAPLGFSDVAALYRAQVPGYVDRLTEEEQQRELVYELTLLSAKVDTWLEREIVEFEPLLGG
jgi:hypothetical protein